MGRGVLVRGVNYRTRRAMEASAASVRTMRPAALDDFFASKVALKPLVGTLERGVDGGLLVGLIEDLHRDLDQTLTECFTQDAALHDIAALAAVLHQYVQEAKYHTRTEAELQLQLLRGELEIIDRDAAARAAAAANSAATALILEEKLAAKTKQLASEQQAVKKLNKTVAAVQAERAKAARAICDGQVACEAAQQRAQRDVQAAQRASDEVKRTAEASCEWRLAEMREQLDAMQLSMAGEAKRADTAEAALLAEMERADVAEVDRDIALDKVRDLEDTREGLLIALRESQCKRAYSDS